MGSQVISRDPAGIQPCSLVIGARDDSIAGDRRGYRIHLRGRVVDPSPRPRGPAAPLAASVAGTASYGYCAAKSQFVWGMRLVLVTDSAGVPVGYTLVAASEKEYEPVRGVRTADNLARCNRAGRS